MAVLNQLQPSFNNGEISPLLYDRVDYQKFVSSVKSGKNMFVHAQGGMSNRAGTLMLAKAKDAVVRLIPFEFSNTETYMIECGNKYCRFHTTNGLIVNTDGTPYEIVSPFATADLENIRFCQSGDVMYLAWGGKPQMLIRYGHTNWEIKDYDFNNGPIDNTKDFSGLLTSTSGVLAGNYIGVAKDKQTSLSSVCFSSEDLTDYNSLNVNSLLLERAILCNNILFSSDNTGKIYYSQDAISWNTLVNGQQTFYVCYTGSFYLLFTGGKCYKFNNFSSINDISSSLPFNSNYVKFCGYLNSKIAVGCYDSMTSQDASVYLSDDAVSWDKKSSVYWGGSICFFLDHFYIFSPINNIVYIFSNSFVYQTQKTLPLYNTGIAGVFNNVMYSLLHPKSDSSYNLYKSVDGTNWTVVQNNTEQSYGDLFIYENSAFVRLGTHCYQIVNNLLTELSYSNSLFYLYKIISFTISSSESKYVLSSDDFTFTDKNSYNKYLLKINKDATSLTESKTISGSAGSIGYQPAMLAKGNWSLITSGSWQGKIGIYYSYDKTNWTVYREYSSATASGGANYNITGNFTELLFVQIRGSILGTISYSFNLNNYEAYIYVEGQGKKTEKSIFVQPEENSKLFIDECVNIKSKMAISYWGPFSKYPTDVELYQDRIEWFTNNHLDATKISDYNNFGVSTDVTDDDAISVIIKDKKINKINTAIAGNKLVVFTDSGNFIHNNDTFTPNSATFLKQGSTGGANVKPVIVRDNIIYVHPMKQAISDYAYNFETDGYAGQDITILANHLFENKKIKELAYQQEPYSIIWVLQEEGTVLACTYLRQQQVIAWTPMDFGGKVISIGVLSDGSNQELYLAVQRKNGTFVEKMPTRLPVADPKDRFFVDCGRTYRGEPATVITGLEYLNGETVVALADGYVVKDLVVANGQITLPNAASVVTVGLPYESVFETLTFDVNNGDGSNLNRKKRVVAVSVRYYNSRGSKISVNGHREVNMLERKTSNDDTDISLRNGFYREILPSSHDEPTTVKIRQDEPLPITIVSVIPELEYER